VHDGGDATVVEAMIVTLPLVILVLLFPQRIAAGLTAGSVKG
jgi:ABC-type glycerol-3-phosphate transport system permease component